MAIAPRTFLSTEPFEDLEEFLEHLWLHLKACELTQALAPSVEKLLTGLDTCRADRRALARVAFGLKAKEIFKDDELDYFLDLVKAILGADKTEAGIQFYKEVFEHKGPGETRKYILGQQLVTMSAWPGKLGSSPDPKVKDLGVSTLNTTNEATVLLNAIGGAMMLLDQFDLGARAAFIDVCNATVKLVFGQLSDIEHNPPPAAKGPIPAGFVDRFFLREKSSRTPTIDELEKTVTRTRIKLKQQEDQLEELKGKQLKELKDKQAKELAEKKAGAASAKKQLEEAEAELAKLQAEIDGDTPS